MKKQDAMTIIADELWMSVCAGCEKGIDCEECELFQALEILKSDYNLLED